MTDHGLPLIDHVRCRAEHAYPGRPLEVFWQEAWLPVLSILEEHLTPSGRMYRAACKGGIHFVLEYDLAGDRWAVSMVE